MFFYAQMFSILSNSFQSRMFSDSGSKFRKFENFDLLSKNIDHLTLRTIFKYRRNPSVIGIASEFTKECFSFNTITMQCNHCTMNLVCQIIQNPYMLLTYKATVFFLQIKYIYLFQ